MSGVEPIIERVGATALTMLIHGTVLAGVTWLLCATLLRRARPAVVSALWTLVLIKFVLPIGPALPVSLSGALDQLLSTGVDQPVAAGVSADALVPAAAMAAPANPPWWLYLEIGLAALYLGLVGLVAARRIRRHLAARRSAAEAPQVTGATREALERAASVVGLRRLPRAVRSETAGSPHLLGIARPILVIPVWLTESDLADELEAALIHELAHVRRRDTWLRGLQLVVGTLLFFVPVVAWTNRRLDLAREMACDDWVIARGKVSPRSYARVLVSMARRGMVQPCATAAMVGRQPQLARRVDHLLARRTRRPMMGPVAGAMVGAWAVISLAGPARADQPAPLGRMECVIDDGLIEQILAAYPEADSDGDGDLTRDEICAHQARMKRQLVDEAFDGLAPERAMDVARRVDPAADLDGDGVLSDGELDRLKSHVAVRIDPAALDLDPLAFPGQVCEEAANSCAEPDEAPAASFPAESR